MKDHKIKIAVIIDTWFPAIGGGQINAWEISKRLAKKDILIDIITRNNGKDNLKKIKYLNIYKLGPKSNPESSLGKASFLFRLFIFVLKRDYDLIHVHPFLPALSAKLLSLIKGKPIIFTVHGTRLFEKIPVYTPSRLLERFILTGINYNVQISVTRAFLKIKNINKNIVVIPNGINHKEFNQSVKKSQFFKIIWVGRFDPVKRVQDLILATYIASQKIANLKLVLIGYGYEKEKIKKLVKNLNLSNVDFKEIKERRELIKEYKSSHLFVLPSTSEGLPLTLLEAQAAGLPIVATNVGGIPEVVKNGENGILVPPRKPQLLANAIINALGDKKTFGENAFKNAQRFCNWEEIAKDTLKVYKNILNG